jgi:hypothetical protein
MPKPMRKYDPGIRTVTVNRWLTCPEPGCQQQAFRSRTFTGPLADQESGTWDPDPRCVPHLRAAKRAAAGVL